MRALGAGKDGRGVFTPSEPPAPPASPSPPGENEDNSNWVDEVLRQAPVHHLGHFLDRFSFAALQTTSATMQKILRNVLRARNEKLPSGQRIANLGGSFCVSVAHKELLRREGRQPWDIIITGGRRSSYVEVNSVRILDLVTKRCTTLAPMVTARKWHASAALDRKLFVMGGITDGMPLFSVECLDLDIGRWSAMAPMHMPRYYFAAAALGGKVSSCRRHSCSLLLPELSQRRKSRLRCPDRSS